MRVLTLGRPALLLMLPTLMVLGCSHTIPSATSRPQPPPQIGKTPPVLQPLSPSTKQVQAPESLLPVCIIRSGLGDHTNRQAREPLDEV